MTTIREKEEQMLARVKEWLDCLNDLIALTTDVTWKESTADAEIPVWVRKAAAHLQGTMFSPATRALDDLTLTPYRTGYAMGIMRWGEQRMSAEPSPEFNEVLRKVKVSTWAKRKLGQLLVSFFIQGGFITRAELRQSRFIPREFKSYAAKLEKKSLRDASDFYRGMADGLRGVGHGVPGDRSNLATDIHFAMVIWWRAVARFRSVTELHAWLVRVMGAQQVGEKKRIEKICERVELTFREPGRPKKTPTLALPA